MTKKQSENQTQAAENANSDGPIKPSGHEQGPLVVVSLVILIACILGFRVFNPSAPAVHWSWYAITGIQTFFAFLLPVAYPGYAVFAYTAGLGKDGPGTRLEAFYINSTMGMVLGIPRMAMVDHFMFLFAPFVMLLGWMPWAEAQVVASGLACLCGLYMALWIPTNLATGTKDPGPFVLCGAFVFCSFFRVFGPNIAFEGSLNTLLLGFNIILCLLVLMLSINGIRRSKRATQAIALTNRMCSDIGEGPVWQAWPKNADFPTGWWFEPPPFGDEKGWPFGPWPSGPSATHPPQEMIAAAAEEMRREIPLFLPLWLVVGGLFVVILGFVAAVFALG